MSGHLRRHLSWTVSDLADWIGRVSDWTADLSGRIARKEATPQ